MKNSQRVGLAQSTSDEDVECRALEALVLAIDSQLDPPPPLGVPNGARRWGGWAAQRPPAVAGCRQPAAPLGSAMLINVGGAHHSELTAIPARYQTRGAVPTNCIQKCTR